MTLNNAVEADILSTCNALGSEIKGVYEKGNDCIECLKDILRYLKRDDDDHSVLRFLGSVRLLQTDLLPILKQYYNDKEIFDFTLRILVALTNPALLLYNEDLPDDKIARNVYLQLVSYLQSYKNAFVDLSVWNTLYERLKELLKMRPIERSSNENLFIERIIILIRNVLHVAPEDSIHKITDDDLNPNDRILQCLHESRMNILLLYMAANEEEHQYCLHILEIVSLMLREHTPETLARSNETRSFAEKENDLNVLLAERQKEQNLKLQKIQSMCKSRFNGVYCVKNMKSISDKDYIMHRLVERSEDIKFDGKKDAKRKPKNRMKAIDVDNSRSSTLSIRLFLKRFCVEFLKIYNKIMVSVKREILRKVSEEHDDTYYLWALSYFMEFNRLHDFQPALVSETITRQSFHQIQTQVINYQEMMLTDKKKAIFWAKRMQLGVSAYKELLETLKEMEKSQDEIIKNNSDVLISHVFYVPEYHDMLLSLLSNFDEVKFPLSYLSKVVECVHLFLKMLENHSKKHSEIVVQKKQKMKPRRKKKKAVTSNKTVGGIDDLNQKWELVTSELSAAVQGRRPLPNVTPFDGASGISFEEQKVESVYKIREALIANEPLKALGLLRAARELWPEGDSFGSADIEPEPEFLVLREIHFSDLQRQPTENVVETEDIESNDSDEEMEAMPIVTEQKLDLESIYHKYASHKVVQSCSLLLANYQKNKPLTNASLIKLLHRIAWHCKMHALFFQSSIFLTFQKIFHDPDVNSNPLIKEFYRFARYIVQKFFAAAEKNDKIFVELLFWKGKREAYELEEGYETSNTKVRGWTEEEETELKDLFDEFKDMYMEGQDVADLILAHFSESRKKTKPEIISALKRLSLIKSVKDLKPEKRKEWMETEIIELQNLFEDYKNSDDIMAIILEKLSIKRSRKAVVEKLLELNLITDKKELRKKTKKKNTKTKFGGSDNNSSEESDDNFYNENNNHSLNVDSSGDEDEINFFKNLEAERFAGDNNNDGSSDNEQSDVNGDVEDERLSAIWEEHEIITLTSLFQENHASGNILDILLKELPRKRPKKDIIEKLLELTLIKDKKELSKKNSIRSSMKKRISADRAGNISEYDSSLENEADKTLKPRKKKLKQKLLDSSDEEEQDERLSSIWEEYEIITLTSLFQDNCTSDNILDILLKELPRKRPKKDIIEKLLELTLIKDKKELNKKNSVRSSMKKRISAGNISEDDGSLENEADRTSKPQKKKLKQRQLLDSSDEDIPLSHVSTSKPSQDPKNKPKLKKSRLWEEKDIVELSQLFVKHKDSDDVISNIIKHLSFKETKKNIIEKLLEIGLIKDKTEMKKKRGCSSIWNEKEVSELNKLYLENKDADDTLSNIKEKLTFKQTKKNIIEKLLEMGLIKNKSELVKKLPKKPNVSSSYVANDEDDDDQGDFDDVDPTQVSLHDKDLDNHVSPSIDNFSTRHTKRKRLVIDSDDSSDGDDANLIDQIFKNDSQEQNIESYIVPKLQKKKMRLLDDSDSD